jgi:hypothetical protein
MTAQDAAVRDRGMNGRSLVRTLAFLAGVAAPVLYLIAVVVGGWITPGYSHAEQAISELTAAGMPRKAILDGMFVAYDLLVVLFALVAPLALGMTRNRAVLVGAALLAVTGLAGLGMSTLFPMDQAGAAMTAAGRLHIALAAVASLGSMGAVLSFGIGTWRATGWRWFSFFSFACVVAILVSGAWAAAAAMASAPLLGVAERVTIGLFLFWLAGFALALRPNAWRPAAWRET